MDPGLDLQAYGRRLYERRASGVVAPLAELAIGDWRPEPNHCHANCSVARDHVPELEAVRGWLYFTFGHLLGYVRFTAHSVVRSRDRQLHDITPTPAFGRYPFIPAEEDEETFHWLVENVQHLDYYPVTGQTIAVGYGTGTL